MPNSMESARQKWDLFISHASEDKESFVRPLAVALQSLGVSVWYDEFSLRLGESLCRSIDKGIAGSRFGLVVVSPNFIAKAWTEYELRGLVSREIGEDRVILPIWHGVSRREVLEFSPSLSDKIALRTDTMNATEMAIQILREVRPDLYSNHPRAHLERIATGEALQELQEQIEIAREELAATREELAQFKCPYCGGELATRGDVPLDSSHDNWDIIETFACGYQVLAGRIEHPCPMDPRFPRFEEFELSFREHITNSPSLRWQCFASGKTDMAQNIHIQPGFGATKEDAVSNLREAYKRLRKS